MSKDQKGCSQTNEEWPLIAGPRQKNEATEHLEYIVYSYLASQSSTKFSINKNQDIMVEIKDIEFNLTQILQFADFEHLSFNKQALDRFHAISAPKVFESVYERLEAVEPHLHMSEKIALNWWTRAHAQMQDLLVKNKVRDLETVGFNLALICIACHGLSKYYFLNRNLHVSTRIEEDEDKALSRERKEKASKNELVVQKGFTGSTLGKSPSEGMVGYLGGGFEMRTHFFNPGPDISLLSAFSGDEKECLYPPHTEIKYQFTAHKNEHGRVFEVWEADAYRTLNGEKDYKYSHIVKIEEIAKKKIFIKMDMLYVFLTKKRERNTHSRFRGLFDTVNNGKKIKCLSEVIDEIKKPFPVSLTIQQMYDASRNLIKTISASINENKKIVAEANAKQIFKASLGNTHTCLTEALETMQQILTDLTILDPTLVSIKEEKASGIDRFTS